MRFIPRNIGCWWYRDQLMFSHIDFCSVEALESFLRSFFKDSSTAFSISDGVVKFGLVVGYTSDHWSCKDSKDAG